MTASIDMVLIVDLVLLTLLCLTALAIMLVRHLFAVVALTGAFSLLSAGLLVTLDAVDVAFTEAAVGAGISTVLMLGTLALTKRREARSPKLSPIGLIIIFFTGATASIRGGAGFSAFSGAKFALRSLSQSMARELGPQGIHVAHFIIDGAIDTPFIKENFPQTYALKEKDGILQPKEIAEAYWNIHVQHPSAWTQEMDLRPYMEKF